MVGMWTCGDCFKTGYFIVRQAPAQFWICGMLQVGIDISIFLQVFCYRNKAAISWPQGNCRIFLLQGNCRKFLSKGNCRKFLLQGNCRKFLLQETLESFVNKVTCHMWTVLWLMLEAFICYFFMILSLILLLNLNHLYVVWMFWDPMHLIVYRTLNICRINPNWSQISRISSLLICHENVDFYLVRNMITLFVVCVCTAQFPVCV